MMINGITSALHGGIPLARGTFTSMAPCGEMAMVCKQDTWSTTTAFLFLVKIKTVIWGWLWTVPELLRSHVWREHVGHCFAGRWNFALVEKLHSWRRQLSEVEWFRDRLAWKCDQNVSSHVSAVKWACAFADCKYQQTLILVSFEYRWLESRRKQILFLFVELVSFI